MESRHPFLSYLGLILGSAGFPACLTCLFLGMRGVMRLGGFVASGGPYEIAHPAPDWVWVVPVSIIAGIIFVFIQHFQAKKTGGLSFLFLAWPALFLSLGYNFMEFTFTFQKGHVVWAWLICGILFIVMGGVPLLIVLSTMIKKKSPRVLAGRLPANPSSQIPRQTFPVILSLVSAAAGIYCAILFFRGLSG